MTEQTVEDVTIAELLLKHRYYYQDIGPIHYICWCHEPHTHFLNREGWAAHVAEEIEREYVARAKAKALQEAADYLADVDRIGGLTRTNMSDDEWTRWEEATSIGLQVIYDPTERPLTLVADWLRGSAITVT